MHVKQNVGVYNIYYIPNIMLYGTFLSNSYYVWITPVV